jgi:hypothetical protein
MEYFITQKAEKKRERNSMMWKMLMQQQFILGIQRVSLGIRSALKRDFNF